MQTNLLIELIAMTLRNKKLLVFIGALIGALSTLSILSEPFSIYLGSLVQVDLSETSLLFFLLVISFLLISFAYLQSGDKEASEVYNSSVLEAIIKNIELQQQKNELQFEGVKKKLEIYESEKGLSDAEKQAIVDGVVESTSQETIKTIFEHEANELKDNIRVNLGFERLSDSSRDIVHRLRREIADLRLRSNINLLIGMSITAVGLYLLWSTVSMVDASELLKQLASEGTESNDKFFKSLILPIVPRILLVVFIEVFAYFFLRLYKDGLSEIKYFQNELTNIESKITAVEFSYITDNQEGLKFAIEALSRTERNFILEKGQTTVELERAKSESELTRNIIKTIPDFFKKANK